MDASCATVNCDIFDEFTNVKTKKKEKALRYTLKTNCLIVQVISYGATVTSIQAPDKNGKFEDVVLGFNDMKGKISLEYLIFSFVKLWLKIL